ncbi:MAG: zf-HC2 domain-containing protein [Armatimonadota bacterium]|nr:zf-HC2 domain-containing protein [Armatimonadota bacterium]
MRTRPPCAEVEDLLLDVLTGSVEPTARQSVRTHLAVCAECRARAAALGEIVTLLRDLPDPSPPRGYWETLNRSLEGAIGVRIRPSRHLAAVVAGLLAAVVLAAVSTQRLRVPVSQPPDPIPKGVVTASMHEILPAVDALAREFGAGIRPAWHFDDSLPPGDDP